MAPRATDRGAIRAALARRFGIDPRALAALRVALGGLLLADLAIRAGDLVAFYTDAGVLPRAALREGFGALAAVSIHALSGAAWFQALLFVLAGAAALSLAIGYRTTAATVVSFVLLASLHARNPVLLNGGDSLLRRLLFWGAFLPLGARWSIDARRRPARTDAVVGVASAAILVQVVLVYAVNAAFKLRHDAWLRGTALRYVFGRDHLTVLLGDVLAGFPALLALLGWLWLAMVVSSVLLVVLTGRARALFAGLFVAMHLGMFLSMRLGLFPLISIAGLLVFLPAPVWDRLEATVSGLAARRGVRSGVDRLDRALPALAGRSPPWVTTVARGWRRAAPAVVALLLGAILVWNAVALGYVTPPGGTPDAAARYRWDMFATPSRADGWYVMPGRLESGDRIDALRRSELRWDRPPDTARAFPNHRWMVYLLDLRSPGYAYLRPHLAEYLCRRWNVRHDDDLLAVSITYLREPTRFDGPEPIRRIDLGRFRCPGGG